MIWSLQVLRLVAALMVVYLHAALTAFQATGSSGVLPPEIQIAGTAGVDIFFVISGVIITRTGRNLTWQQFAWKRLRRIVPIYYLASIPAAFVAAKAGFGWREVVTTITLWPALDVMTAPILPVAWTLCFEMLFYGAATLVLFDRRFLPLLLGLFAISCAFRSAGPVFQFIGNPIIIEFLIGVALAFAPPFRAALWGIPLGATAILIAGPLGITPFGDTIDFLLGKEAFQRVLVYGVPAGLIVYGTMQVRAERSIWTYLGDGSYTLYLFHTFPISLFLTLWNAFPLAPDIIILLELLPQCYFHGGFMSASRGPCWRRLGGRELAQSAPLMISSRTAFPCPRPTE
ncbi:acyltransferase [Sinorhizobium sp. 8-89]|uniref:acyltransferase family protein n=1 Tax=Sinorhizobium sp. 7-81 TaxID=3049087 RepID=UPI0024C2EB25|nr:acyltransferase [Sinorhizobium sp. 7-81]MDK1388433.1 acyltransferase [Sinorhizobium sp. 7-81]